MRGTPRAPARRPIALAPSRALRALLPSELRPRGPVERRAARRRRVRAERCTTYALAAAALISAGAVAATELVRAWRGRPVVVGGPPVVGAARGAIAIAVAGYRGGSTRENALLNMLVSFTLTWALVRASTHVIRSRGTWGPLRDLTVGEQHIHHFVPGIVLALAAGGAAIGSRHNELLDPLLAVPFGVGSALVLDESALLLRLDDVYWTEEGIVSVQISLAAVATLSALALTLRALRRGEELSDVAGGQRLR